MAFSKYRRSHTVIIFIILMNKKKSVSISVCIENKIRLNPCVHITFCSHLSLFMNVNFIRHWWMMSHLCRIRVLWFPLKWNWISLLQITGSLKLCHPIFCISIHIVQGAIETKRCLLWYLLPLNDISWLYGTSK